MTYCGQPVPNEFRRHVLERASKGQSPEPLFKFWERLQKNPSKRSVDQLFPFVAKTDIPIAVDGCFLAYKKVRDDYMDVHSGTISNKPGTTVTIPRNLVSDDPREACHYGLHVGARRYAGTFGGGGKMVVCKVDPEHVVCVPYDSSQEKMRVCQYFVIGNLGDELPSSLFEVEELETARDDESKVEEVVTEEIDTSKQAERVSPDRKTEETPKAVRVEKRLRKNEFDKFKDAGTKELMEESIDTLRKYATYGLEIVGASKIPGGKAALIARILKDRKKLENRKKD